MTPPPGRVNRVNDVSTPAAQPTLLGVCTALRRRLPGGAERLAAADEGPRAAYSNAKTAARSSIRCAALTAVTPADISGSV